MAATKEQLKELESQVVDAQEKVVNARQAMNQVNTHIALMEREKKRVDITLRELDTVGEAHQTYRSVGRMFVLTPVPQLQSDLKEKNATCGEELSKLAERKAAAQKSVDDSENHFRKTFMGYQKAHQELSANEAAPQPHRRLEDRDGAFWALPRNTISPTVSHQTFRGVGQSMTVFACAERWGCSSLRVGLWHWPGAPDGWLLSTTHTMMMKPNNAEHESGVREGGLVWSGHTGAIEGVVGGGHAAQCARQACHSCLAGACSGMADNHRRRLDTSSHPTGNEIYSR
eukprot:CAMPEP_0174310008 /NCGR_PEP_ID=MMETSP0810-20121108/2778_1 /TAXON_ID=73025 ORGANISM="Eutreptiella gymnastica-like, Strain CCMP1594" /NCGR_SAMPLE_ID=MMETSP0810 /ASSEMBLY_ACC=CAM_ASM_000659 /LENGTH=285 /DNA_ID=CAMNT_0015417807 /DNA_START=41 /DNA_END=900 /DNA_ORIENTATION=-